MAYAVVLGLGESCYISAMTSSGETCEQQPAGAHEAGPLMRLFAQGGSWSVAEYICSAGPGDPSFEETHETFTIAAVVEGSFRYTADTGASLLHSGGLLLGNFGACFECGHDHSRGDRCIAIHLSPDYFAEVSASASGRANYRFRTSMLPAGPGSLSWVARAQSVVARNDAFEIDETVIELLETVIAVSSGETPGRQSVSATDERRISAALHLIEDNFSGTVNLDGLASSAAMSKYHFVRTFRRITGTTPYQYVLALRMRQAAIRLVSSSAPISEIAFDAGFGDLSTFISQFRRQFGEAPSRHRARYRSASPANSSSLAEVQRRWRRRCTR